MPAISVFCAFIVAFVIYSVVGHTLVQNAVLEFSSISCVTASYGR